jgi:peptidoglycan/LPS O-acetylase OafA/YrhL
MGAASYSLYLVYQSIGAILIVWRGAALHLSGRASIALPIAAMLVVTLVASAIYDWWESLLHRRIVAMVAVSSSFTFGAE